MPQFVDIDENIDYIGVLDYLKNNQEVPYSNPEANGITEEKRNELLQIKTRGQNAVNEMKKMAKLCEKNFGLSKCIPGSWLDGSNTKTRRYLWTQMKYSDYADNPISISIFVEKSEADDVKYRISLEIKNDGATKNVMDKYHSFLDKEIDSASGLVFVSGSNEQGRPTTIYDSRDSIKQKLANKEYRKVQLSRYIDRKVDETNDYYQSELLESVKEILPYYEYVIGYKSKVIYPSLEGYDPGISAAQYKELLSDGEVVKYSWLDVIYYLYKMGGEATCKQIALKYGVGAPHYSNVINVARAIANATGCPTLIREDTGGTWYWPVLFFGYDANEPGEDSYCYIMREPLKEAVASLDAEGFFDEIGEENFEMKADELYEKNLILYGPPGTGKTYNSATYAVAICDGKKVEELTDYDAVMARYKELQVEGRIAFTTFHQSYGYEEFIEGIKPVLGEEKGDLGYKVESGVFKKFCKDNYKANVEDDNNVGFAKENPRIWGMLLGGTGETQVKKECFSNNVIRLGFNEVDDKDIQGEYGTDEKSSNSAKRMVDDFINAVEIGDIVVVEKTNKSIDAIGVVTGDYYYDDSLDHYKRTRAVKWLTTSLDQDMTEFLPIGRKQMARNSIFNFDYIGIDSIFKILAMNEIEDAFSLSYENTPCVFIIDEINRGNISKIFGELITLIEDTKRKGQPEAASAILPYSGEEFSVPSNVYILGTMNTADRSIQLMDTALRRRFRFIEKMPDADVLRKLGINEVNFGGTTLDIPKMLEVINDRIAYLFDREHTIGHAFFTGLKDDPTIEKLASIFERSVIPLLQEYFYEDYQKIQMVLGDNAKEDPNTKFIVNDDVKLSELFMGNVEDMVDEKEMTYRVNKHSTFTNIMSYKTIAKGL